jgi:hypothetical protein
LTQFVSLPLNTQHLGVRIKTFRIHVELRSAPETL